MIAILVFLFVLGTQLGGDDFQVRFRQRLSRTTQHGEKNTAGLKNFQRNIVHDKRQIIRLAELQFLAVLGHPAVHLRQERRDGLRSEEHTSELQSLAYLVCRLLLEKKKK